MRTREPTWTLSVFPPQPALLWKGAPNAHSVMSLSHGLGLTLPGPTHLPRHALMAVFYTRSPLQLLMALKVATYSLGLLLPDPAGRPGFIICLCAHLTLVEPDTHSPNPPKCFRNQLHLAPQPWGCRVHGSTSVLYPGIVGAAFFRGRVFEVIIKLRGCVRVSLL